MGTERSARAPGRRPDAVLWDMDGTIVDTEPYWIAAEYDLVAEFGGTWTDALAHSIVGLDLRDSAKVLRDKGGVDLPIDDIVNRLLDGVIHRFRQRVPWRPGARELLATARKNGIPNALVTMSWKRFADAVVAALPPGAFDVVVTGDDVEHGKPHPEPYRKAAALLGVKPADCLAIEDSPTGVRSAVAAGCRVIAVPNAVDVRKGRGYTRVESLIDLNPRDLGLDSPLWRPAQVKRRRQVVGALGFIAVAAGITWFVTGEEVEQVPPLAALPVSAWAPYWTLDDAANTVYRRGTILHEVSPFWFEATGASSIGYAGSTTDEDAAPILEAAAAQGVAVIPTITDAMPSGGMAAVLHDPGTRTAHVSAITTLVTSHGYDGIDIDYETFAHGDPDSTWTETRADWVEFVGELGDALHAEGKELVVTVPPIYDTGRTADSGYWVYDVASIEASVDTIRVMAYDYSTSTAGPIAPIEWTRTIVQAMKAAVDDDSKVVLGVPMYGRNWVTSTDGTCPPDAEGRADVALDEIDGLVAKRGATPTYDPAVGEASFTYTLDLDDGNHKCTQHREVHYVDETGVRARVDVARGERLGGVVLWALGFDSVTTWIALEPVAIEHDRTGAPVTTVP